MNNCTVEPANFAQPRGYSDDPSAPHLGRQGTRHGGARIRFLGGRGMNTAERSRGTSKYTSGRFGHGRVLTKALGFLGAGGHSVAGRSLLSSDVGVRGSASSSFSSSAPVLGVLDSATSSTSFAAAATSAACRCSASGGVEGKADASSRAVAGSATAALVLIGVSAGRRTSPASGDLIWRGELWVCVWGSRSLGGCRRGEEARRVET